MKLAHKQLYLIKLHGETFKLESQIDLFLFIPPDTATVIIYSDIKLCV